MKKLVIIVSVLCISFNGCAQFPSIIKNGGDTTVLKNGGDTIKIKDTSTLRLYIVNQLQPQTVNEGSTVTLNALAAGGRGLISVVWHKVGGGTLSGSTFTATTTAQYYPVFTDGIGATVQGNPATITVTSNFHVGTQPVNQSPYYGDNISLSIVFAGGVPPYSYAWTKVGTGVVSNVQNPTFTNITANAQYYCVGTDVNGFTSQSITINVNVGAPFAVSQQPVDVNVNVGQTLNTSIVVSGGKPPYTYYLYKNNTGVIYTASNSFSKTAALSDAELYIWGASDAAGHSLQGNFFNINVTNTFTDTIRFAGNSISYGLNASPPSNSFANLVAASLGYYPDNRAVPGSDLQYGLTHNQFSKATSHVKWQTMMWGANESNVFGYDTGQYRIDYKKYIDSLTASGIPKTSIIIIQCPYSLNRALYKYAYSDSVWAVKNGYNFIPTYKLFQDNAQTYMDLTDSVHFTNAGHAAMAARIIDYIDHNFYSSNTIPITFNSLANSRTSISIFDASGKYLLRSFTKGEMYPTGTQTLYFDGKNEDGSAMSNGVKTIVTTKANITSKTFLNVGNNSDSLHGSTVWYQSNIVGLAFTNGNDYALKNITENNLPLFGFNRTKPRQKFNLLDKTTYQTNNAICTNGNTTYITAYDTYGGGIYFQYSIQNNLIKTMPNGFSFSNNAVSFSAFDTSYANNKTISNAVQKNGNLFFSGHENSIKIYDTLTYTLQSTFTGSGANKMVADNNGHLFVLTDSVRMYNASSSGLTFVKTFTGVVSPLNIDVSPSQDSIAVVDAGTNNIKIINISNGGVTTFGQVNHYFTDATVYNDAFYFRDIRKTYKAFVNYSPDGKLWVGDFGNNRTLIFDGNRTLVDKIEYQSQTYFSGIDPYNTNHLYLGYLRFDIDYVNKTYTLAKNYGANRPFTNIGVNQDFSRPTNYYTLNGHIYTSNVDGAKYNNITKVLYEVTDTNWREIQTINGQLDKNLNVLRYNCSTGDCSVGTYSQIYANNRTGFDGSNNPIYAGEVLLSQRVIDANTPSSSIANLSAKFSNGQTLLFEATTANKFKLAWLTGNEYIKLNAPTQWYGYHGAFPPNGDDDIQSSVGGSGTIANVYKDFGFNSYKLEGYKGQYQGNYTNIWDSSSNYLGQIGTDQSLTGEENPLELTSNSDFAYFFGANSKDWWFANSESFCGCGKLREVSGLDSVTRTYSTITINGTPTIPPIDYIKLFAEIPFKTPNLTTVGRLTNGDTTNLLITSNTLSVTPNKDLYFTANLSGSSPFADIDLGTNNLSMWSDSGLISFPDNLRNNINYHWPNAYIDWLDNSGKTIARLEMTQDSLPIIDDGNGGIPRLKFNGVELWNRDNATQASLNDFKLQWNGTNLIARSLGHTVTTTKYDNTSNPNTVKKIHINYTSGSDSHQRLIDLWNWNFYPYLK